MIPKKIHYIWLGGNAKPKTFKDVFESWKKYASSFEIQEWTEKDLSEFDLPDYFYRCLKQKKWAFASDVLRFHILNKYGGIYLDIDEMLLKNIDTKELLSCKMFLGKYHEIETYFGFGFIGAEVDTSFSKEIISFYNNYCIKKDVIVNAIGSKVAIALKNEQDDEITLFPQEYFYPLHESDISEKTYAKHLSNTSWVPAWKKKIQKVPFYKVIKKLVFLCLPKKLVNIVKTIDY